MSNRLPIVQWQFQRGSQALTCAVSADAPDAFTVMTLPHGDIDHGAVETFAEAGAALQRHAFIATQLRDTGWSVTSYTQ